MSEDKRKNNGRRAGTTKNKVQGEIVKKEFKVGSVKKRKNTYQSETMEEFFYFLKGSGQYIIDGTAIPLKTGVFLRIPARIPHALSASGDCPLEFIYFGISTQ